MLKTRLRDFLVTKDNWLFAVSDYFRTDGIRATLRYVPDKNGERELNVLRYKKYDFGPAFEFMREHRPEWVQDVHVVPESEVKQVLRCKGTRSGRHSQDKHGSYGLNACRSPE